MNDKVKILFAEDEVALGQIVKESLETRGFEVLYCQNGKEALNTYHKEDPHLLVLDVMMPQKDGFSLVREIRETDSGIPVILLTARSQTRDVVEGFRNGANDYLKKPFSMEELIVRIQALLNRVKLQQNAESLHIGEYTFNFTRQTLVYENEETFLTHREAALLFHLYQRKNELLDRSYILKELWGDDDFFSARSMDVFITRLRKKLKRDENVQIINVRGYGYKLVC